MLGAACPVKRAFIPIAGFARFENIDRVWAIASAGTHISTANKHASMRSLMRTAPPDRGGPHAPACAGRRRAGVAGEWRRADRRAMSGVKLEEGWRPTRG